MDDPIGTLLILARSKAKSNFKKEYTAQSKTCGCEVRVSFFTEKSSLELFSRCIAHPTR